jgi:hypothetical protein
LELLVTGVVLVDVVVSGPLDSFRMVAVVTLFLLYINVLPIAKLWPHYGPGVDPASNRSEYQEYSYTKTTKIH